MDASYPRRDIARTLIFAIGRYSNLSKDASSSLINLGQAIHSNATTADMMVFIQGTLAEEVYARNACLQAMQVRQRLFLCICKPLTQSLIAVRHDRP